MLNNAYGLQCSKIAHKVKESLRLGKLDCVVQSTDKNFMVPVGGSIIFTQDQGLLKKSKLITLMKFLKNILEEHVEVQ